MVAPRVQDDGGPYWGDYLTASKRSLETGFIAAQYVCVCVETANGVERESERTAFWEGVC